MNAVAIAIAAGRPSEEDLFTSLYYMQIGNKNKVLEQFMDTMAEELRRNVEEFEKLTLQRKIEGLNAHVQGLQVEIEGLRTEVKFTTYQLSEALASNVNSENAMERQLNLAESTTEGYRETLAEVRDDAENHETQAAADRDTSQAEIRRLRELLEKHQIKYA